MVSKDQREQDIDNELPALHERCDYESDDEDESIGEKNINKSKWEINNVHTSNIYDNEFPPLPTIDNTIPTQHQEQDREQHENKEPKEKIKINNVNFGDDISQDPQEQSTRIFFQNVNGLELSTTAHTLITTCI